MVYNCIVVFNGYDTIIAIAFRETDAEQIQMQTYSQRTSGKS